MKSERDTVGFGNGFKHRKAPSRRRFPSILCEKFSTAPSRPTPGAQRIKILGNPSQLTGIASRKVKRASFRRFAREKTRFAHVYITYGPSVVLPVSIWARWVAHAFTYAHTHTTCAHTNTHAHPHRIEFVSVSRALYTCFSYFLPSAQACRLGPGLDLAINI